MAALEPTGREPPDPIDAEMEFHFAETVESLVSRGWTEPQAKAEAERRFGDRSRYRRALEKIRQSDQRRLTMPNLMLGLLRDVRYAGRSLLRSPGFTTAAVLALALGIGANTAVFSVVNAVLLRPLPFEDPDRLVMLFNNTPRGGASVADFLDWKTQSRSFETLDVFEINRFTNSRFTWTGDGEPTQVLGFNVTATFFETLGVGPLVGRTFEPGDDQPGRAPGVIISERLWRERYGANPDVLGRTPVLNGRPHTIIGVVPAHFEFWQRDVDAWAILTIEPPTRRGPFFVRGIGRLKAGITIEQAAAELDTIAHDIERKHPADYNRLRIPVLPLREIVVGDVRPLLVILSCTVGLVLLIAVSNVANLLLGRSTGRQREIATRLSVGADRAQLIRQLLIESLTLSLTGGVAGIVLATTGVTALRSLAPLDLPRVGEIGVDGSVLAFTIAVCVVSAILFGLFPALDASRRSLTDSLKDGGRGGESRRQSRVRAVLVVAQVTLSVVLVVGAGLLIRSLDLLGRAHPGFRAAPDHLLTMLVTPTGPQFERPGAVSAYWHLVLERVRSLPGVEAASLSNALPPDRRGFQDTYGVAGKHLPPGARYPAVPIPFVSHDYFKTLDIPLIQGRWFDERDTPTSSRVAVISRALAHRNFPDHDPLGERLEWGGQSLEIVGIVGDVAYQGLGHPDDAVFYQLTSQSEWWDLWLSVRTAGEAQAFAEAVRQELRALDPDVPVERIGTMAQALSQSVSLPRFRSLLMAVFATVALLLAALGIYSVIAYSVAQRTREIGLRMALGATASGIVALVVGQGARWAILGLVLGLAGAFALARGLEGMLFGVTSSDPLTFIAAAVLLGTVAIAASLFPALVAARTDPIRALRTE